MRISIRWNLILSIGLPLAVAYAALVAVDYVVLRQTTYETTETRLTELAATHAARLEGELREIAQVAHSTVATIEAATELDWQQIGKLLEANVGMHTMIFGAALVFDPAVDVQGSAGKAPYVHRIKDGLRRIDFAAEGYDYASKEWYTSPIQADQGVWIEPFFDEAGEILMCTYALPFRRDGKVVGVVKIDISLEELQVQTRRGEFSDQIVLVLSSTTNFIVHPHTDFIMKMPLIQLAETQGREDLLDLANAMINGRRGMRRVVDFPSEGPHLMFFAPVPAAGWSFLAVAPEASVMAPVSAQTRNRAILLFVGLIFFLAIVYFASTHIAKPVQSLAKGVARVAKGDLEAQVPRMRNRDELGDLADAFNQMVKDLKVHVEALDRETTMREKVEGELRVGRAIQASLLPRIFPPFPDRTEFDLSAVNVPAREVAGDFFDYFFVSQDVLTLVVADVSGKGVPAALFMAVARTVIRNLAQTGLGPIEILERANKTLIQDNDRGLFVTVWIGQYNTRTGKIQYANGGHPPPYLLSADGHVSTFGQVSAPLVGIVEPEMYEQDIAPPLQLNPGDALLVYTDGIPEAISPDGEFFHEHRFKRLLHDLHGEPVGRLCKLTIEAIDSFQGEEAFDDCTLLALQRIK
jgi:sigma-B regulation protein RsbU (phosphoserine phosphatase)